MSRDRLEGGTNKYLRNELAPKGLDLGGCPKLQPPGSGRFSHLRHLCGGGSGLSCLGLLRLCLDRLGRCLGRLGRRILGLVSSSLGHCLDRISRRLDRRGGRLGRLGRCVGLGLLRG